MAEVKVGDVIRVDKMFSGVTDGEVSTLMAKAWERDCVLGLQLRTNYITASR